MRVIRFLVMVVMLALGGAVHAQPATGTAPAAPSKVATVLSPNEIVAAAAAQDWIDIAASDLLVMDLAGGRDGNARRVVIQLMPWPFSQGWVGNIRKLAVARWWDGTSINRVQDNYVVQWGDPNGEDTTKAKALPSVLVKVPQASYLVAYPPSIAAQLRQSLSGRKGTSTKERRKIREAFGDAVQFDNVFGQSAPWNGWPTAFDENGIWPVHCYGMVGVGRDMPPDTGTGAELYTVIGHAPRHLDRNIALVGRVIAGIEQLSSLPRGTGPLGFYEKPEERVKIISIRLGNTVAGLARYQYLSTESAAFAKYADARANRRDAFFIMAAGGADICNIPVPVRVRP